MFELMLRKEIKDEIFFGITQVKFVDGKCLKKDMKQY